MAGYDKYIDVMAAARERAAARKAGTVTSNSAFSPKPAYTPGSRYIPPARSGRKTSDLTDLEKLQEGVATQEELNTVLGNAEAGEKAQGDKGLLNTLLDVLQRPKSAIVGGLSAAFGLDDEDGDDTNDGFFDRIGSALSGERTYGSGDFGALRYAEGDEWYQRAAKAAGAFVGDVALDPLTYVGGVGIGMAGVRGGAQIAGQATRASGRIGELIEDSARSGLLRPVADEMTAGARAASEAAMEVAEEAEKKMRRKKGFQHNPGDLPTSMKLGTGPSLPPRPATGFRETPGEIYPSNGFVEWVPPTLRDARHEDGSLRFPTAHRGVAELKVDFDAPPVPQGMTPAQAREMQLNDLANSSRVQATGKADRLALEEAQTAEKTIRDRLALATEEGFFHSKGRGVRQNVDTLMRDMGLDAEDAAKFTDDFLGALPREIRGGFGLQIPFGPALKSTAGAGRNIDRAGLGTIADDAYNVLAWARKQAPYRAVANKLGGRNAELSGEYLKGNISFEQLVAQRSARDVRLETLTDATKNAGVRLSAINQILNPTDPNSVGFSPSAALPNVTKAQREAAKAEQEAAAREAKNIRDAVKDVWGRSPEDTVPLSGYTPEELLQAEKVVKLVDDGIDEAYQKYLSLGEYTNLLRMTPEDKNAIRLFQDRFQPRMVTDEVQARINRDAPPGAGLQAEGQREGLLSREFDEYVTENTGVPLTNQKANDLAAERDIDTEFITDPVEAYEKYVNGLVYKMGRLEQVKILQDAGMVRRVKGKEGSFVDETTDERWVAVGKGNAENRILSSAADDLYVPEKFAEPISKMLTTDVQKAATFIDNTYKPMYSLFKQWATVGRGPGYHARNAVGAGNQNYVNGVTLRDHKLMAKVMREESKARDQIRDVLTGKKTGAKNQEIQALLDARIAVKGGDLDYMDLEDLVTQAVQPRLSGVKVGGEAGDLFQVRQAMRAQRVGEDSILLQDVGDQMLNDGGMLTRGASRNTMWAGRDPEELSGLQKKLDVLANNWWLRKNTELAQNTETYFRGSAFINGARRIGMQDNGEAAGLFTKALHFDYSDLTEFERNVMKNLLPFYTFLRNNIPAQLGNVVKQPGRITSMLHFQNAAQSQFGARDEEGNLEDSSELPKWVRDRLGFVTDVAPNGAPLSLMVESPAADLNKLFTGNLKDPINPDELVTSANPFLKVLIEGAIGKDTRTGQDLDRQIDAPWYMPVGGSVGANGQRQVSAGIPSAITALLPPVGVVDRLSSGKIEEWTTGAESKQQTRAFSNRASLLAGAPLMTWDEGQQTNELIQRTNYLNDASKREAYSQNIDDEELKTIRALIRKGASDERIARELEKARLTPLLSKAEVKAAEEAERA